MLAPLLGLGACASMPPAKFTTEDYWMRAGYSEEMNIYTVFIANQDTRTLRCETRVRGYFLDENGVKSAIKDKQVTILLPGQRVQSGNWTGMDQASGSLYKVKCAPRA